MSILRITPIRCAKLFLRCNFIAYIGCNNFRLKGAGAVMAISFLPNVLAALGHRQGIWIQNQPVVFSCHVSFLWIMSTYFSCYHLLFPVYALILAPLPINTSNQGVPWLVLSRSQMSVNSPDWARDGWVASPREEAWRWMETQAEEERTEEGTSMHSSPL